MPTSTFSFLSQSWLRFEKTVGGLKFAVVIILLFASTLTVGTIQESTHGTEYANRLIYKSWWFMGLQAAMFLSILTATLLRLPPKRRLYGFYVLHAGLLIIFIGSFITYTSGIDGQLPLMPGTPSRQLELPDDTLTLSLGEGKTYKIDLPATAHQFDLNRPLAGLTLRQFLPYAGEKIEWVKSENGFETESAWSSGQYLLANDRFAETLTFSLHPQAAKDFEPTTQLGPLAIHYLPAGLAACLQNVGSSQIIIWDSLKMECFTPETRKIPLNKTNSGNRFLAFKQEGEIFTFFPDISPFALSKDFMPVENSRFRTLSLKVFTDSPNLLIFGDSLGFYDKRMEKEEGRWQLRSFIDDQTVDLPWMGFRLKKLAFYQDHFPQKIPFYESPIQAQGQLIKGERRAIQIELAGQSYWVKDNGPLEIPFGEQTLRFFISKKNLALPFELTLDRFKMDHDPGTMNPASYESFTSLFDGKNSSPHHVFMNNPLKYQQFTLYQASYFETEQGYGSVLSVNYDPGRPLKYAGCLLLVLGSIWHFVLNPDRRKKNQASLT